MVPGADIGRIKKLTNEFYATNKKAARLPLRLIHGSIDRRNRGGTLT
jgi:hypothetical protein